MNLFVKFLSLVNTRTFPVAVAILDGIIILAFTFTNLCCSPVTFTKSEQRLKWATEDLHGQINNQFIFHYN